MTARCGQGLADNDADRSRLTLDADGKGNGHDIAARHQSGGLSRQPEE
jgi:hypothetical protein